MFAIMILCVKDSLNYYSMDKERCIIGLIVFKVYSFLEENI